MLEMPMRVLGINSVYHESSAALAIDGVIIAAAEEERFNRRKHGKAATVHNADELPSNAMQDCLKRGGITGAQVDAIAYSFDPRLRESLFQCDPASELGGWGGILGEEAFRAGLARVPARVSSLFNTDMAERVHWVPHHIAHAASSFFTSGCESAALLVVDGIGEHGTVFLGGGNKGEILPIEEHYYPQSIGFLWEKMAKYLGFGEYDACKIMALAAYGDCRVLASEFESFARIQDGLFQLDPEILQFRLERYEGLEAILGSKRRRNEELTSHHFNIAAALQEFTTRCVMNLAERLHTRFPAHSLCYAGGVALNCATNWQLKERGPFEHVFIPSAPHDAGTAVGAALLLDRKSEPQVLTNQIYTGAEFNDRDIQRAIAYSALNAEFTRTPEFDAAALIAEGQVVGWFQGRAEFGPRALGNRSLLADPRRSESRTRINAIIKRREYFRPFGPSVLDEEASKWFDLGRPTDSLQFMLFACPVLPEKRSAIPAVLHVDDSARLQLVRKVTNFPYHTLLREFYRITGVPLVLNTSFNDNEPIVNSPNDAIQTFAKAELDALVIGNYIVRRGAMRRLQRDTPELSKIC